MAEPRPKGGGVEFKLGTGGGGSAGKEVVCAWNPNDALRVRRGDQVAFEYALRAELVGVAGDKELGHVSATGQKIVGIVPAGGTDRQANADQPSDARVPAAGTQADIRPEAEPGKKQWQAGVAAGEPVEGGLHIPYFAPAIIVRAFGQARAAKVEAQHWEAEVRERLGRVINDLVVHRTAAEGMRMSDEGGEGSIRATGIEQGLEATGWTAEVVDGLDGGSVLGNGFGHRLECSAPAGPRSSAPVCWRGMSIDSTDSTDPTPPIDPIALTRELVAIDSTTYHEGPAGEFLAGYLSRLGWMVERQSVAQPDPARTPGSGKGERFNVYASWRSRPAVVLSTHMDTVPPFLGLAREDATYLYGRGVCDAKGIIAAQIAAAEQLRAEGIAVGLLFVVGEERDSAGAAVANANPRGSRFLINGEPTDNRLALASKGALRVELRAHGRMAHSAYPELGESAIDKLLAALHDIQALDLPVVDGIGDSTMNVGLISGGRAPNVIADAAEAHLLVRLVGSAVPIRKAIVSAVHERCEVEFSLELPFVQMRALPGFETMVAKFTTDIPSLTQWGEPFLLGPGSIHTAHTPDERIAKAEILDAVQLYARLVRQLNEQAETEA